MKAKGLCQPCYDRQKSRRRYDITITSQIEETPWSVKDIVERVMARTEKSISCWLWRGTMHVTGRSGLGGVPILLIEQRRVRLQCQVRRFIYRASIGPLRLSEHPQMTCGVDRCINPEHMKAETRQEIHRKAARNIRPGTHPVIIPDETVQRIVDLFHAGHSTVEIAERLGVHRSYISPVVRGKIRRSVTGLREALPSHVFRARRLSRGDAHSQSKLTWQEVLVSVGLLGAGYTQRVVGENFGIDHTELSRIKRGAAWKWLTGPLTPVGTFDAHASAGRRRHYGAQHPRAVLTEATVLALVALVRAGVRRRDIMAQLEVSRHGYTDVVSGRCWSWLTGIQPKAKRMQTTEPYPGQQEGT